MIREGINLSDIIDPQYVIKEPNFNYAGINGSAEIIGYKVIFFKINKENSTIDSIRFYDIIDENEVDLCNYILEKIKFPVDFNSNLSEIYNIWGKEISRKKYLVNCIRYWFMPDKSYYVAIDISEDKITGMEIVYNPHIIDNILL